MFLDSLSQLQGLWGRRVWRGQIFETDNLAGLEETIWKIFPDVYKQLCVLHTVRKALTANLTAVYTLAETEEEVRKDGKGRAVGNGVPSRCGETKAYTLLAFLRHPKPTRRYLYISNPLERLAREVKRRTKVVEVFCEEKTMDKLLHPVLSNLSERLEGRRLRIFAETHIAAMRPQT